jgi:hypothetical protein
LSMAGDTLQFWMDHAHHQRMAVHELANRLSVADLAIAVVRDQAEAATRDLAIREAELEVERTRGEKLASEWEAMSGRLSELQLENERLRLGAADGEPDESPAAVSQPAKPKKNGATKPCKACGNHFLPDLYNRLYCSADCAPTSKRKTR